jgi:hypothetical protein
VVAVDDAPDSHASEARRGELSAPTPRPRSRVALRTLNEVAEELARVYRLADRRVIEWPEATKRAFVLTTLGKVIEAGVIERRLSDLEELAHEPIGEA